ncbi:MAG: PHP domain-containing protein, partial [Chloroflexi bacterium]|nr:PHP domain-containing protein [Chloroflexota bacterium]
MNSRIDLHLHSTASDGRLSPTDVVKLAASRGLRLIALTDHDTTNGCDEAQAQGARENLRVIAGVELNTDSDLGEVHILGYLKDIHQPKLQNALDGLRIKREERARQIVEKL